MKKENGFTLIELLAIIVILAIIAVITVPIILNIIDKAKEGTAINSAYGYKDAIKKYYVSDLMDNNNQALPVGYVLVSELPNDFDVDGEKPTNDSWLKFSNGNIEAFSLKFGDYVVTKYTNSEITVEKGTTVAETQERRNINIIISSLTEKSDGAKYLPYDENNPNRWVRYYNPSESTETLRNCSESDYNNNQDKLGTTGCLKWIIYSVKNDYVNMLLDHNINVGCTGNACYWAASNNNNGPVLALSQLSTLISSWNTGTPKVPNKYGDNGEEINPYIIPSSENVNKYQINYSSYKARLMTRNEASNLGCSTNSGGGMPFMDDIKFTTQCTWFIWILDI